MKTRRIITVLLLSCALIPLKAQTQTYYQNIERPVNYIKLAKDVKNVSIFSGKDSNRVNIYKYQFNKTANGFTSKRVDIDIKQFKGLIRMVDDTLIINYNKEFANQDSTYLLSVNLKEFPDNISVQEGSQVYIGLRRAENYLKVKTPYLCVTAHPYSTVTVNNIDLASIDSLYLQAYSNSSINMNKVIVNDLFAAYLDYASFVADDCEIDCKSSVMRNKSIMMLNGEDWDQYPHNTQDSNNKTAVGDNVLPVLKNKAAQQHNFFDIYADKRLNAGYYWSDCNFVYGTPLTFGFSYDWMFVFNFTERLGAGVGMGAEAVAMFSYDGEYKLKEVYLPVTSAGQGLELKGTVPAREDLFILQPRIRIPIVLKYYFTKQKSTGKAFELSIIPSFTLLQLSLSNKETQPADPLWNYESVYAYEHKGEYKTVQLDASLGIDITSKWGLFVTWCFLSSYETAKPNTLHRHTIGVRWSVR